LEKRAAFWGFKKTGKEAAFSSSKKLQNKAAFPSPKKAAFSSPKKPAFSNKAFLFNGKTEFLLGLRHFIIKRLISAYGVKCVFSQQNDRLLSHQLQSMLVQN
jgi:hypothetical protein